MNGPDSSSETPAIRRLVIATSAIVFTAWLGDFLFWSAPLGLSIGVYFAVIGSLLLAFGKRTRAGLITSMLLAATVFQSAVELSFTNFACLVALSVVLFAETVFGSVSSVWPRWSEGLANLLTGPFRWPGFLRQWSNSKIKLSSPAHLQDRSVGKLAVAAIPALIAAVVFSIFLSSGNAILAELFLRFGTTIQEWFLDLSFPRAFLWLVFLTLGLALFWPNPATGAQRWWTRPIPHWNRSDEFIAKWQSLLLLGVVNVLFFTANTIDVIYLWADQAVPSGVNHSQFVHEGVHGLIAAVVLAAIILVAIFQQQPAIGSSKGLRALALLWIAQNIVLITGVLRRLLLYVEAFQLSELRVYVACFLALVTSGFLFLAGHALRGMNLGKLIFQNAIATFVLFFGLQFCDVSTWVANWNVDRWQDQKGRSLDLDYLQSLGPGGWPALSKVANGNRSADTAARAQTVLRETAIQLRPGLLTRNWRSIQTRRDARAATVIREWGS